MRLLVVSDLHGDLDSVRITIDRFEADGLLGYGDWGDPDQLAESDLAEIAGRLPLLTRFDNHDPLGLLARLLDRDGSPVLLGQGEVRTFGGLRVAAIGGIWARSHRLPHDVTDDDVAGFAGRIASPGPVDVLLTHGCPIGLADQNPKGTRGGQRCFPRSRRGRSKPSARSTPGSKAQAARASKIGENRRPDLGQGERSQIGDGGRRGIARTARTASAIR